MKRRFGITLALALLLVFQMSPLAYADSLPTHEGTVRDAQDSVSQEETINEGLDVDAPAPLPQGEISGSNTPQNQTATDLATEGTLQTTAVAPLSQDEVQDLTPMADDVTVDVKITGLKTQDGFLEEDIWIDELDLQVDSSTNALAVTKDLLTQGGFTFKTSTSQYGESLDEIAGDSGALGVASSSTGYSYWQFLVNGTYSDFGADATAPKEGDVWEWRYINDAQAAFAERAISIKITGVEKIDSSNIYVPWLADTKYYYETTESMLTANVYDATLAVLEKHGMAYKVEKSSYQGVDSFYINSITKADGTVELEGTSTETGYSWWEFFDNGVSSWNGAYGTVPVAGSSYEFRYSIVGDDAPVEVVIDPEAERPNYEADKAGFSAGRVTESSTPTTPATTVLAFSNILKAGDDWGTGVSEAVLVNGNIYLAVGQNLIIYDGKTGAEINRVLLANAIGSTCRPLYTNGIVVVPLGGGRLQAFTADTLTCVWITEALSNTAQGSHQSNGTLTEANGYIFYGTSVADWTASFAGTFFCINAQTGKVLWKVENDSKGYYWAGAVEVNGSVFIANDAGNLSGYDAASWEWNSASIELGAAVRSSLVSDGTYIYAAATNGTLYRIALGEWGSLGKVDSLKFGVSSTSSPVIYDGKLYVGGEAADYLGVLAVIDLASFTLEKSVSLPAPVQSSPLMVTQDSAAYVYFTCNTTPGGVYCYRYGDSAATMIYTPTGDDANWCMASVAASSNGMLYYTNDSGKLFALMVGTNNTGTDNTPNTEQPSSNNPGTTGTGSIVTGAVVVTGFVDATTGTTAGAGAAGAKSETKEQASTKSTATDSSKDSVANTTGGSTVQEYQDAMTPLSSPNSLPVLPIVGIGVAVCGLAVAGVWLLKSKSSKAGV